MQGKRLLHSICIRNLLSYGPVTDHIELQPLNVLIGPNGSGKSNLIAAIDLLRSTPDDMAAVISQGGGIDEWLWKGGAQARTNTQTPIASIDVTVENSPFSLDYSLAFTRSGASMQVVEEAIEGSPPPEHSDGPYYLYHNQSGNIILRGFHFTPGANPLSYRAWQTTTLPHSNRSALQQLRGPNYPELSFLAEEFGKIRFFRTASFGPYAPIKDPQSTDLLNDFVMEDGRNLSLVIHRLREEGHAGDVFSDKMRIFIENFERISTLVQRGTIQVALWFRGMTSPVPMSHLSDGTLRYLSLLAILCDPEPPPLICIEEPELGMHPDIIPVIAELLAEASRRTQLIVTTHSDLLVSQFDECPEAIIVCEQRNGETQLRRLQPDEDDENLSLGDRWLKGQLGGTRW